MGWLCTAGQPVYRKGADRRQRRGQIQHIGKTADKRRLAFGNLATALAVSQLSYLLVALGMIVSGSGAGLLNGTTQKAILGRVPRSRSGMGSGISTTTRFVGIVLAVGGLGGVLATRTDNAQPARVAE